MRWEDQRKKMVEEDIKSRGITDSKVLEALRKVPRQKFVPDVMEHLAYMDSPLAIGSGQTISQPYTVAFMMQALDLSEEDTVLELGTGSGYQAALLAEIASEVYTVERIPALSNKAKEILDNLGYDNIHFAVSDGTLGWPEADIKFDKIIVTAAAPEVPRSLKKQLKESGKIVIPVGNRMSQQMAVVTRQEDAFKTENLGYFCFVPLIGEEGWSH